MDSRSALLCHLLRTRTRGLAVLCFDPAETIRPERDEEFVKQSDVETRIIHAREKLRKKDQFLLEKDVNERSITHNLAQYLEEEFSGWDVDCEYNRVGKELMTKRLELRPEQFWTDDTHAQTVYPDIIVHQRGKEDENLLVIEAKKKSNPSGIDRDESKLKAFAGQLGYEYCALVTFDLDQVSHRFITPAPRAV